MSMAEQKSVARAHKSLLSAREALLVLVPGMIDRHISPCRISRIMKTTEEPDSVVRSCDALPYILSRRRKDGGWSDVEETAWCTAVLAGSGLTEEYSTSLKWFDAMRSETGGWGLHERDTSRIITTSLVAAFVPELAANSDYSWLEEEWARDLSSDITLSYKGGFMLMAFAGSRVEVLRSATLTRTIEHLIHDQNEDGGFGPWKGHPIGSDPWSTGICLVGLCSYSDLVEQEVIERAVEWLGETQLPSGLWPYHFIDEGSAYAYWGLKEALKVLNGD